jgi:hypothetical protein
MIRSSRRERKAKATAEVLAMIADAKPPLVPHQPLPAPEIEEWLFESATEFIEALDEYYAKLRDRHGAHARPCRRRIFRATDLSQRSWGSWPV